MSEECGNERRARGMKRWIVLAILACWGAQAIGYWGSEIYANERARMDRVDRSRRPLFSTIPSDVRKQIVERAAAMQRAREAELEAGRIAESE